MFVKSFEMARKNTSMMMLYFSGIRFSKTGPKVNPLVSIISKVFEEMKLSQKKRFERKAEVS